MGRITRSKSKSPAKKSKSPKKAATSSKKSVSFKTSITTSQILQWYGYINIIFGMLQLVAPKFVLDMHQIPVPASDAVLITTYLQWMSFAAITLGLSLTIVVKCGDQSAIDMVAKYQKWGFALMIASNLYVCFGGLAASAWGSGFTQMDAMGIHSWTVVAALFCTNLCMTSNGQVKTGKAPANSGLKDAFKFNKAPKQYTSCRIGYAMNFFYGVGIMFFQNELCGLYSFPQSDNAVLRMVSIAWAGALIQAGICGAAVVRSHSAKTIYRMTRLNGIMMIAGVFFVATWKTVFTGRGNNDCADAMTGQAVLYAALAFFAFHAIEGKAQKGW